MTDPSPSSVGSVLERLEQVIQDRKRQLPDKSYTTTLFRGGTERIGQKILEESNEVVEAAGEPEEAGRQHLIRETADLLYHLMVMLSHRETHLKEVAAELGRRFGISGIDEKASRNVNSATKFGELKS